jgi:hypothetical protein
VRRGRVAVAPEDLEGLTAGGGPRHDCVCDFAWPAAGLAGNPRRKRKGRGATSRDGVGGDATGGVVDVPRYLCRRDDGRQHAEAFETDVAAAGSSP